MIGSAALAMTTQRWGENLWVVFSYVLRAGCLQPLGVPCCDRWGLGLKRPIKAFSLWDRCLLMSTSQLDGYLHLSSPHSQMNIVSNNQTLTVPLATHTWSERAIQFIPLLVGLGIAAGIGMGI